MTQAAISDEKIIAALLNSGTIKEAAAAAGISERAIYDRMNKGDFKALYKAAKNDLLREAVFTLNGKLREAIDTISEIMTDKENKPAIRLQAAQAILNNAGKFAQRLAANENDVAEQVEANRFDIW